MYLDLFVGFSVYFVYVCDCMLMSPVSPLPPCVCVCEEEELAPYWYRAGLPGLEAAG